MNDQMNALTDRVARLEAECRRWKAFFVLVVIAGAVGVGVGANLAPDKELKATKVTTSAVILVDEDGEKRGEFACKDGSVAIHFFSEDDGTPLSISTTNLGTSIMLSDMKSSSAIALSVEHKMSNMMKKESSAEPSIWIHGPEANFTPKITIDLDEQMTGRISIQDDALKAPLFVAPVPKKAAAKKSVIRSLPANKS